jgi:2-haloacid dehalogenase
MGLSWVLFNLTGTLVDPTVLAQPLGDSGADEDLVLSALDDTVGDSHTLNELMAAAMRRRLRLVGADAERADAALALVSTMPAYIEAPGALESLRGRGLKLGVLSQSSADATDSVLRFAGLRDRFELVLSAQDAGAFKPDLRPYRYALEQTEADAGNAVCMVSTHWWDVAAAKRAGLRTGWVARRERSLLDTVPPPDYTGRDLAEVAEAIVTRMS